MKLLSFLVSALMASSGVSYGYSLTVADTAVINSVDVQGNVEEIMIPESIDGHTVSGIENYAFVGCVSAKRIIIPDTVITIGDGAFMSCTSLEYVRISNNVRKLPDDCFFACPSLRVISVPERLESLGNETFFGCSELDLYLPESVTSIGEDSFGKYTDPHTNMKDNVYGFLVKGVKGSYAEEYSVRNGIDFIDMDDYKAGDVNGDNFVNASDASEVLEEYAKVSTGLSSSFTKKQKITGDIDFNGKIDAGDASGILEIYAILSTN